MQESISGIRVLLVEDREDVRAIATMMLTRLGCSVVAVATAEAALAVLEKPGDRIQVVFADIQLPGAMSGYDLAKRISGQWPGVRTVITSGAANTQVIRGAARHEGYRVIGKPYNSSDLLDAIRQALAAPPPSPPPP